MCSVKNQGFLFQRRKQRTDIERQVLICLSIPGLQLFSLGLWKILFQLSSDVHCVVEKSAVILPVIIHLYHRFYSLPLFF